MSLFGGFLFWAPTHFPETICLRYGLDIHNIYTYIYTYIYTHTNKHSFKYTSIYIYILETEGGVWHTVGI